MSDELHPDSPLNSPDRDRLGYADFAEHLADTVVQRTPSNGYTVGIYGQWGSGKSTILNFVEKELKASDADPTVIRFNPWWFSGQSDLLEKFLQQLIATLDPDGRLSETRERLATLSSWTSKIPIRETTGYPIDDVAGKTADLLKGRNKSIGELKSDIDDELEEADEKIIVIIDDLDRLTPSEITQMFQIIQSVANFSNIVYILAFDQDVVINSLEREGNINDPDDYLEKIIQLPLRIPKHRQGDLKGLFKEELSEIAELRDVDSGRLQSLLDDGISPLLQTPRDAIRLANAIDVTYNTVEDEVNFVDLVGIECLRIFHKNVYEKIRSSPDQFAGARLPTREFDHTDGSSIDVPYEDSVSEEEEEAIKSILMILFPKFEDNVIGKAGSIDRYQHWSKKKANKRICHQERISVYFRLKIPEGEISATEMNEILAVADDPDELTSKLEELLDESSKVSAFIEHLQDTNINQDRAEPLVQSLFSVGDDIIKKEPTFHPVSIVNTLVSSLEEINRADRIELLENSLTADDSLYLAWQLLQRCQKDTKDTENTEDQPLLEPEDVDSLNELVTNNIKAAASADNLLDRPKLQHLLRHWKRHGDTSDIQSWIDQHTNDTDDTLTFIYHISEYSQEKGEHYADLELIEDYVEIDELQEIVDSSNKDNLSDKKSDAVDRLRRGVEQYQSE